jgi:non-specific serine/threonine protein kinase
MDALAHLYDPAALQRHPLAGAPAAPGGAGPSADAGRALRQRLLEAVARFRPPTKVAEASGAWRRFRLLELRYVEALPPAAVQERLGIAKSHYYREHARALDAVVDLLGADRSGDGHGPLVPPSSPAAPPAGGRLPQRLTGFVGRERELAEVQRLLAGARLLTLTGAGGVGKSRLALELARRAAASQPGGDAEPVRLLELAPLADAALVPQAAAEALGVVEQPGRPLVDTLIAALRPRPLLLVLDNCEHLLGACAALAVALLEACPPLRVLATSREPLGATGEQVWRVPPLGLPPPAAGGGAGAGAGDGVGRVAAADAVRLFVERARLVCPDFALTPENAAAVAEVCRRLDGLPLALELAAARVRVLPPVQLLSRLEDRFRLLTGGSRTAPARHQTLRAAVDWSYALLTDHEQRLFGRLAVFAGGFTLEAAEAVCADPDGPGGGGVAAGDVLDLLTRLADKSLVVADAPPDGTARYRLLETLRQYARQRLAAGGAGDAVRRGHAAHYLALAEQAAPELEGPRQLAWLGRLEAELGNLRQALRWSRAAGGGAERAEGAETGLRLAAALRPFWRLRGRHREGRAWLEAALALPGAAARTPARAEALCAAGSFAGLLGDGATARTRLEASVALWRELGDARGLGRALAQLGFATTARDAPAARALLEEAVALARAVGDRSGLAVALRMLGNVEAPRGAAPPGPAPLEESAALFRELGDAWGLGRTLTGLGARALREGDQEAARDYLEEALARRREADDQLGVAWVLNNLGALARRQGEHRRAEALLEEGRALAEDLGYTATVAYALAELGHTALAAGDSEHAAARLTESLRLSREHGTVWLRVHALAGLAACAAARGQPRRALRLGAAAAALGETTGQPLRPADRAALDGGLAPARRALPAEAQAAAWAEGRAMTLEQAVADALEEEPNPVAPTGPSGGASAAGRKRPRFAGGLTARQAEVLGLVALGRTDRQIAAALGLSAETVGRHLSRIYRTLGVASRAAAAAAAVRHGLA